MSENGTGDTQFPTLQHWVGKTETQFDTITPFPLTALAATIDSDPPANHPGDHIQELRHWLFFLPTARHSELGSDGHPKRGGFLPPVPLPRRMWAGSQFIFHQHLRVGDQVARISKIDKVTHKTGRHGDLVFVRVNHTIHLLNQATAKPDTTNIAITEFHDIVYRTVAKGENATSPKKKIPIAPENSAWCNEWTVDDVMLFRYSALTFNGHRIHYDRQYACSEEGYPGLVVHGPLVATLLLDAMREKLSDRALWKYEFKAISPLFDIDTFFVCGEPSRDNDTVALWAKNKHNQITMTATATLYPQQPQ